MMVWIVSLVALVCFVGAAALLVVGLRGRLVDDHPLCRGCGFDLIGLRAQGDGESESAPALCPECGAGLGSARAIRIGNRVRRKGAVAVGAAGLAVCLLVAGAAGWGAVSGFQWNRLKPAWMLEREAESGAAGVEKAALVELVRRAAADRLDEERHARLAALALEVQASETRAWHAQWGDLVELAWKADLIGEEARLAYMRRTVLVDCMAPERAAPGESIPLFLEFRPGKAGSALLGLKVTAMIEAVSVGELAGALGLNGSFTPVEGSGVMTCGTSGAVWLPLAPGEHEAVARTRLLVHTGGQAGTMNIVIAPPTTPALLEWTEEFDFQVAVTGADKALVTMRRDESLRAAFMDGTFVERAEATASGDAAMLEMSVRIGAAPMAFGFAAFARSGEKEWPLGHIVGVAKNSSHPLFSRGMAGFDGETIDLVLRPDAAAGQRMVEITEIWDGEIVIRDVPVVWSGRGPAKGGDGAEGPR